MDSKKEGSDTHLFGTGQNWGKSNENGKKEKERRNSKPKRQIKTL